MRELVEVEAGFGAYGALEKRPDLPDLELKLPQEFYRAALNANHVPHDRALRPPGDERLGEVLYVHEGPPSAAAVLFYGHERDDLVGPNILTETQRNKSVLNYFHDAVILTWFPISPTQNPAYNGRMVNTGRTRELVGEGVDLRRHRRENYPLYARWYGDEEVWRLTSWAAGPMRQAAVERLFRDRELSSVDDSFAIHREGKEEPVGVIGLMNVSEANASADLSIIVGSAEDRDQGVGTEAIRLLLRYAFEELRLHRVGLSVFAFNEPAISTYEKIGFAHEGRLKEAIRREDAFYDAILMSVLADDWHKSDRS